MPNAGTPPAVCRRAWPPAQAGHEGVAGTVRVDRSFDGDRVDPPPAFSPGVRPRALASEGAHRQVGTAVHASGKERIRVDEPVGADPVSYTHLRAHETD